MKSLSVRGDYIMQMINGTKKIEYRTWKTKYRGPILMCSTAKRVPNSAPGYALCVMDLYRIDWNDVDQCYYWYIKLKNLIDPIKVKGQLKLFNVDDDVIIPIKSSEFEKQVIPLIYRSKNKHV